MGTQLNITKRVNKNVNYGILLKFYIVESKSSQIRFPKPLSIIGYGSFVIQQGIPVLVGITISHHFLPVECFHVSAFNVVEFVSE